MPENLFKDLPAEHPLARWSLHDSLANLKVAFKISKGYL
jgi:hypothetical protein